MTKPLTLIVGISGTGKSTSLRNLMPGETIVFNTENKALPFKHNLKIVNITDDNPHLMTTLIRQLKDPKHDHYKIVVIDSLTKWTQQLLVHSENNLTDKKDYYKPYRDIKKYIYDFFELCKSTDKQFFITARDDISTLHTGQTTRTVKVEGGAWKGGECEAEATIVLYTNVVREMGKSNFYFETQSDGATTAKSPMGMFDEFMIPNDLNFVNTKIEEYYS